MGRTIDLTIPEQYKELFQPSKQWRHIVYKGGRSSGKSTQIAISRLIKGSSKKLRGLCTREIQNSIQESVYKLLCDQIDKMGLSDWQTFNDRLVNRRTGSEIFFKGLHNNIQSI